MGKKGKKKPASGDNAAGDQEADTSQPQPVQQPPPSQPVATDVAQSEEQKPAGEGKGKRRGKKQQTPEAAAGGPEVQSGEQKPSAQPQPTSVPQAPPTQAPPPQPEPPQPVATEVARSEQSEEQKSAGEGKGKRRRGKKQQTPEAAAAAGGQEVQSGEQKPSAQPPATPVQQQQPAVQPLQPAGGRGQPQQQQPTPGRGQPQQQQQQYPPGRGQPQQQQQVPPGRGQPQQQYPPGRGQQQQVPPGRGQQQQVPPGRGQPQQQQQQYPPGRGQPQQQLPPPGWGQPQQQQPPPGWGRGQPQQPQQPPPGWGRDQPQQQQPPPGWAGQQQQPPPGWGRGQPQQQQPPPGWAGQQQQPPPGWGRGQPQQQQPPPGWAGQQQQQPPPGWGRGQPQQQQPPPGWAGQQQQQQRVRQTSEQSEGQRSEASFRSDTRERTLSPTSSQGSEQSRGGGRGAGRGGRGGRGGQSSQPQESQEAPGRGRGLTPRGAPRGRDVGGPGRGEPIQQPQTSRDVQPPEEVKKLTLKDMPLVPLVKKDSTSRGTLGRKIEVETNHLELRVQPKYETAIHYDVTITPDKPRRLMRRVWQEFCRQHIPKSQAAFDDVKNAYSPSLLPFGNEGGGEVQVAEDNESRPRTYKVVLKYAATVNLNMVFEYLRSGGRIELPQDSLQCIDIVLRNVSAARFVRVGRSYFNEPDRIISLGDGLDLWHGHFQSTVLGWKPFLNIDVAHKGFPKEQNVIDLMAEMAQARRPEEVNLRNDHRTEANINKFLKGLKILYEIPRQPASRRTYRVNSMVQPPAEARFVLESGEQTTVLQYFQRVKHYNIHYQNLPCLWVGPRDKKIYLPPELCTILAGQVINKKLNEIQTANMVKNAATSTNIRKEKIMRSLRQINFNADPCVRAFGLSVGNNFESIPARILDPPTLQYHDGTAQVNKGVWRTDRLKFILPESCDRWTVLNMSRQTRDEKIDEFVRMLQTSARQLGMNIGEVTRPFPKYEQRGSDLRGLEQMFSKLKSMKLVFVVVPDFQADIYSKVKQVAELTVGCLTQCIKGKTMFKMNPATVGNILLKVNAKLNGLNHQIATMSRPACLNVPCMIMGADVTHPSPDQTDIPSVAAVAASYDANAAFKYNFCWRLQPARQEIITDLENIVKQQLEFFYQKTKQKPRQIIFFRDGVSEGQFREVLNAEVQAMRNACGRLGDGSYKPKITFLVVQKRHHTRFFPKEGARFVYDQRNNNVPAGTLVDTDIIHPTAVEYYLVSHASIQGVARPTKYRVLWDDANMSHDEIQTLTYYLCHMFTRCNRSVSYPAPTYYAHLAAFRARVYLEGHEINLTNLQREQAMRRIKEELSVMKPMFFV